MERSGLEELRRMATEKRDHALAAAQAEYENTLRQLAAIEQSLFDESYRPDHRIGDSIASLIMKVVPTDAPFKIADVAALVKEADPTRRFKPATIQFNVLNLTRAGRLKRVTRASGSRPATFAVPDVDTSDIKPGRPLTEWAALVLEKAGKPMRPVEILLAMVEQGYELVGTRAETVKRLTKAMERDQRFVSHNDAWQHV